jgi:long-chain acyl-CoA synthetase
MDNILPFKAYQNLSEPFRELGTAYPERVLYRQAVEDPSSSSSGGEKSLTWVPTTFGKSLAKAEKLAEFLSYAGVSKGKRVTIISNTRPEWGEAEMAVFIAGGSIVTAYPSDPAHRNGYVMVDSDSQFAIIENQQQFNKLLFLTESEFACPGSEHREAMNTKLRLEHVITFESVDVPSHCPFRVSTWSAILASAAKNVAISRPNDANAEASILYTSGTTGAPKGVVATHAQHLANLDQVKASFLLGGVGNVLHMLPQAHAFEHSLALVTFAGGCEGRFPSVPDRRCSDMTPAARVSLMRDMQSANANVIPVVPRLLEKIREGVLDQIERMPRAKKTLIRTMIETYTQKFFESEGGNRSDVATRFMHYMLSQGPLRLGPKIQATIREKLVGKDFRFFVTGGAALPNDLAAFFGALGMQSNQGYGSTETNVAIAVNTPTRRRLGSIGKLMANDIDVKLADNGELLVRGPNVASGYHGRPRATSERWDAEGWYHTHDKATIDQDGFIFLHGRIDEEFKTSTGEFIQPATLEDRIKQSPFITEAVVIGEGKPSCIALVTVLESAIHEWAEETNHTISGTIITDPAIQELVREDIVRRINQSDTPKYMWITKVALIPELTIGQGLTPTYKVQRKEVASMHRTLVDEMYKQPTKPSGK